jgi:hypothetical protein
MSILPVIIKLLKMLKIRILVLFVNLVKGLKYAFLWILSILLNMSKIDLFWHFLVNY